MLDVISRSESEARDEKNLRVSTISMIAAVVAGAMSVAGLVVAIITLVKMK